MKIKIRMILSKRGYKILMKVLDYYQNEKLTSSIVNSNTCTFYGNIAFFKWDNPKEYKFIQSLITVVMAHRVTYRVCVIEDEHIALNGMPKGVNFPITVNEKMTLISGFYRKSIIISI